MTRKKSFFSLNQLAVVSMCVLISTSAYSLNKINFKEKKHQRKFKFRSFLNLNNKIKDDNKALSFFPKSLLTSRFSSWGVSPYNHGNSINLFEAWKNFKKKKNVVVAVIDTGIDPNHPFLKNNIIHPDNDLSKFGLDFSKGAKSKFTPEDHHGHGTHVSGIIKSILPDVKLLELKYYNPQASGQDNLDSTIAALKYAVRQNVAIINYSGGGAEPAIEELRILKEAERKGILIVAAAGNEQSNIDQKKNAYYPASYGLSNIISVTAYNPSLQMLNSSNYGRKSVDIFAPGYRIKSSLPHGRAGYLTGTSQATAFVTGVAAMIKSQFPNLRAQDIKKIIDQSAKKIKNFTGKCRTGGKLNASAALAVAKKLYGARPVFARKIAQKNSLKTNNKTAKRNSQKNKKIFLMK